MANELVCHPDGTPVTNAMEIKWLQQVQPGSVSVGKLSPDRFLHLWFSSPAFHSGSFTKISLLTNGVPLTLGARSTINGGSQNPNELNGNLGWIYWTLSPCRGTNFPDRLTVQLRYTTGPLEHTQDVPVSSGYNTTLENNSLLGGYGQDVESNAFITITENGTKMHSRKFDVQAVTQEGEQLASYDGEDYMGDGSGPRVEKFNSIRLWPM